MTVSSGSPGWYLRRLSRMGPREAVGRVGDTVRRRRWRRPSARPECPTVTGARFTAVLPAGTIAAVPPDAAKRLVAEADRLMAGHAEYFGVDRDDLADPDWFHDPKTGRRAPGGYAFDVPYRNEEAVGDVKQIWELSRHQYLTVLAAAYAITGDERYAERVAGHLRSWWAANAPLRGVHWTSGIELGIRLLSWVWIRRLLDGWPGAGALFEGNPVALNQIWHHQRWLAAFPSRGSSANNHVVAEAAGQFAAACAFGWFPASARWRADALRSLERHLRSNTFASGLNRELATEYHGLVLELGLAAVAEADAAGVPVPESIRPVLLSMTDALAAVMDSRLRPPRQGDADDGHGLVVDGTGTNRWASLLATGDAVFGRLAWWPTVTDDDVRTALLTALVRPYPGNGTAPAVSRPVDRPTHFADAGMTILRAPAESPRGRAKSPRDLAANPRHPAKSPRDLAENPRHPAKSPRDLAENPRHPAESPRDLAENPRHPAESPRDLAENPRHPAKSPRDLAENPRDPAESPRGLTESPRNPAENPREPAESLRGPAENPRDPAESPRDPVENPRDPAESPPGRTGSPRNPAENPRKPAGSSRDPAGSPRDPAEIWCRCDAGPHGFLSIAAHAHADALSVEVRHDGVDVLADPGTFCYHGQPEWRQYFRSTLGHNTLQLDGADQSVSGGPFLWTRHARSRVLVADTSGATHGGTARWCAEHDGYRRSVHRRQVELTAASRELRVVDEVRGPRRAVRLAFHLGPTIAAELVGNRALLTWTRDGKGRSAALDLPGQLRWRAHHGETDPPLGWYSAGFGRKEPATTLVGTGFTGGAEKGFTTVLRFRGQGGF